MKILLTGGSGLLGRELQNYLDCYAPDSNDLDITLEQEPIEDCDIIIHAAAFTDVIAAEEFTQSCYKTNVLGTYNMVKAYPKAKFIYISSEYAYKPKNFYSKTKKWAEGIVTRHHNNYLIIRTSFIRNPFPYEYAFVDQYTQGDYVDVIAPMIAAAILHDRKGTKYIGTGRKTMFELARRTRPEVMGNSVDDIEGVTLQKDYV